MNINVRCCYFNATKMLRLNIATKTIRNYFSSELGVAINCEKVTLGVFILLQFFSKNLFVIFVRVPSVFSSGCIWLFVPEIRQLFS